MILNKLLNNQDVCTSAAYELCKKLKVSVTKDFIKNNLDAHPNQNSLLSISDLLSELNIDNITLNVPIQKIVQFTPPFIVQMKKNERDSFFSVITDSKDGNFHFFDPNKNSTNVLDKDNFKSVFTGIVLLAEPRLNAGQKDYQIAIKNIKIRNFFKIICVLFFFIVTYNSFENSFLRYGALSIMPIIYGNLAVLGCIVTLILVLQEIDWNNPILEDICSIGKKVNCKAILQSKASKIFGISWSSIGFSYFTGILLICIVEGIVNKSVLNIIALISITALPYVIYSVYYQWQIAKEWCILCLSVQGILIIQFIVVIWGGFFKLTSVYETLSKLTVSILIILFTFLVTQLLLYISKLVKKEKKSRAELNKIKYNKDFYEFLEERQKKIHSFENLGIFIGNKHGQYQIVKVCNPYCSPCSKAHFVLNDLVSKNPEIGVRIIFTAFNSEKDRRFYPVRLLLDIASTGDETTIKNALNDWYSPEVKNYQVFEKKYFKNTDLDLQNSRVEAMYSWCKETEISYTPTVFLNGKLLPEIYSLKDLKFLL